MLVMDMLLLSFVLFCCFYVLLSIFFLATIEFVSSPNINIMTSIDSCCEHCGALDSRC